MGSTASAPASLQTMLPYCCHDESTLNRRGRVPNEMEYTEDHFLHVHPKPDSYVYEEYCATCCRANEEQLTQDHGQLESLSYVPDRFEEGSTIDLERSDARYSKIVVHSTRTRTQRRSKVWEDWLRDATTGRSVTLLQGMPSLGLGNDIPEQKATSQQETPGCQKIAAMYYLDRALTRMSIRPNGDPAHKHAVRLLVDNIQVICPISDFKLFVDQAENALDDSEKARAILLQYLTEDSERRRVCFLEESEQAKERFVQVLTALWLEKRNDHSMWF